MATHRFLSVAAVAIFAAGLAPSFAKNNEQSFEGKWVMDKKSPSATTAPGHLVQELKMDGNTLVVKSNYDQPKDGVYPLAWLGIMAEKIELGTDGNEVVNHFGPYTHVSKTTIEGNTVTTTWHATDEPGSVEGQWIRTVASDGRTMTLQIKGKASDGRTIDETVQFNRK
jgi:hypothetical protein